MIVVNAIGGGLGHKYISTSMAVTYALIAKKRLYCSLLCHLQCVVKTPFVIFNATDSCFKDREYVGGGLKNRLSS